MTRRLLPLVLLLSVAVPALGDDKVDAGKLKGAWTREVDGIKLEFKFKGEKTMIARLTPAGADQSMTVEVEYALDKEGVLTGVIQKVEPAGADGAPNKGDKFSFKVEIGKETLVISDMKGVGGEDVKKLVEGEYKKKTD